MRSVFALITSAVCLIAADAPNPALQQVRSVYILPMGNSLDQYLANRLTSEGIFQVVTDPLKADAIFTDHIGASFEQKLDELYTKKTQDEADKKEDPLAKPQQRFGSGSRGRGTVFLVNRASRAVIWSTFRRVKSSRPEDTNHRADDVVKRLQQSLKAGRPAKAAGQS